MTREEYHAHKAQQERRRQIERRGYEAAKGPLDLPLLLLTLLRTGMGLLMLFSASFAISEGWNEMVCVPSQRVAWLRVCARGWCGIMTRISRKIAKPSRIFDAPRQRW